ncbi:MULTISPECIES: transcriptional regulator [Psychrilyobacter]|uniref:Transcriptional regulator n=1 Tax=Psychrilyobacter piezotolerans TaxID=2293438 RepID=A0ABX9KJL5_9FUSO|nr:MULTISPECIES: transcriptional regulator [Psychrilyobacter]MCS5421891.1 transcriptional regulator [Psychrilyobacter sp. S5]NDI76954.1 transcriptional regulator [Psychrilyobacter piezotolerans]RDE64576.1 transcriptional regulator [Psychrilyobacter sp. S5]REI42388.1 transcriptional regulator [Psychrilyobacter piezotolerans]
MAELLTVKEVEKICKVKQGRAYRLMKEINDEMKEKGYLVIRGRVNSSFLYEKLGLGGNDV